MTRKPEIIGVISSIPVLAILFLVFPQQPFMTVYEIEVIADQVRAERAIHINKGEELVADWAVTVVHESRRSPSCQTIPGPKINEGWSVYSNGFRAERVMPFDVWVGDTGCYNRLAGGEHDMFVTWTPRDGSSPVTAHHRFAVTH